ncbi:MAG: site-specific integrase [Gammaproteobacteria bacterium]|nr:site-specific integrase [Gammaproteobacteria bacterium]
MANSNSTRRRIKARGIYARHNADGSTTFTAQVRLKGFKPVAKSFETIEAAKAWQTTMTAELRTQRERGEVREDLPSLTVKGLIEEYLADPETKALRTFADTERLLDWWISHEGAEKVLGLNVLKLRAARQVLSTGRTAGTVNRYLSALRSAWNWGRAAGLIPTERAWPSRLMLSEPAGRVRYLTDDERARLLKTAAGDPVLRAAIVVSLSTGMRQGELLRLEWRDIDLDRATAVIRIAKNRTPRAVHLVESAREALKSLRKLPVVSPVRVFVLADGRPLQKSLLEARWKKLRREANLADFKWHDLRHSCASFLAQHGASLPQIGAVLGHKSPSVTQRYSHLVQGAAMPGHAELDAALKGL